MPGKLSIAMALFWGACLTVSGTSYGATDLPTGGVVAAGAATISQSANTMNVNQSSQRAVVNWSTFDVAKGNTVNFNQPNANASTLNRVNSASQSMINGAVNANGQVVFVNPNGIVFGAGAQVNTGGLVATTMDIADSEYMSGSGKMQFKGNGTGQILNKGKITVNNASAYIALMAPQVINEGVVIANMSGANAVALVAGQNVTLTFSGNQLMRVNVDASVVNALILNKRLIKTEGGQIIIAANSASDLRASVINNTGTISASSVSTSGGTVALVADTITQAGTVSANGGLAKYSSNNTSPEVTNSNANGGNITMQGNTINLTSGSVTSAKGAADGGLINVGTTKVTFTQSADGTRSNLKADNLANVVTVEQNALVDASSVKNGNGGEINIWSLVQTNVAGILKAMGGAQGGNGGFIETSSIGILNIAQTAIVNVTAALGKVGMWLLDPEEMVITSSTATAISLSLIHI